MIPEYFAYFSVFFVSIGYYNYLKDIIRGQAKPNIISWIFWSIAPIVGVYISYKSGVGIPLLISTFMAGFGPLIVVIFSLINKNSYWKISRFDILCGLLSFVAIIIWITTKNGIVSLAFAILADLFAGIPTMIKSWRYSDTETSGPYIFGNIGQIITLLIIPSFSFQNYAFPLYFIIANTIIILGIKKNLFI